MIPGLQNRVTHYGVTNRVTNSKILKFLIFRVSNSMRKKINIVLEFLNSRFLKEVRCQDLQNQNLPFKYKEIKD